MTMRNLFSLVAMIGVVLGLQGSARADIYLELVTSTGGDTGVLFLPGDVISYATPVGGLGGFDVAFTLAISNSPGTPSLASLTISNAVVGLSTPAASGTLTIYAKATNFTLPPGSPLKMDSNESATFISSTAGDTVTFKSYFDASNTAPGPPLASDVPDFVLGTGSPTVSIVSPGGSTGSLAANAAPTIVTRSGDFALSNVTTITLAAGSPPVVVSMNGATTVTAVVPEPSSMALAGLGALGLMGYGLRRRQVQGV